jgi:Cft2 family RNA processing exonuclease
VYGVVGLITTPKIQRVRSGSEPNTFSIVFSLSEKSLYVEAIDLWLDSMRCRERCYVSHGHADHAREHAVILATPNTARICRSRFTRRSGPMAVFEEHAFNESWTFAEHRLTLFSAGHVLGSSQILIEGEGGRFVYTGDFKLAPSLTAEPPEVKQCDVLLMECTYGRPHYIFPSRGEVARDMIGFARDALDDGAVPVFFAYSLGKAQEAVAVLGGDGVPVTVHGAIHAMCAVYESCGVSLPPYRKYDAHFKGDTALIWPPGRRTRPVAVRGKPMRTAMLTGWALDRDALYRYGADRGFALSDHADYAALLRYIELAQPKRVLLNHGWPDFAYRLRRLGLDAEYMEEHAQLRLF